jgi:hypothetical protein
MSLIVEMLNSDAAIQDFSIPPFGLFDSQVDIPPIWQFLSFCRTCRDPEEHEPVGVIDNLRQNDIDVFFGYVLHHVSTNDPIK